MRYGFALRRGSAVGGDSDGVHSQDRTTCPTCGTQLESRDSVLRCPASPGHYTRVQLSEEGLGDRLRDGSGMVWGRIEGDRHARSNPSGFVGR
jgi:hypothetical protein